MIYSGSSVIFVNVGVIIKNISYIYLKVIDHG